MREPCIFDLEMFSIEIFSEVKYCQYSSKYKIKPLGRVAFSTDFSMNQQ